jgi:hypothetical protein
MQLMFLQHLVRHADINLVFGSHQSVVAWLTNLTFTPLTKNQALPTRSTSKYDEGCLYLDVDINGEWKRSLQIQVLKDRPVMQTAIGCV